MELTGKINIGQLSAVSALQAGNMVLVAEDGQPYVSRKVSYGDISAQLCCEIGSVMKDQLFQDALDRVEGALSDTVGRLSADVAFLSGTCDHLLSSLSAANEKIRLLDDTARELRNGLNKLSDYVHLSVVSAILKVANCQLSVKTSVNSIINDLSVEIISF